MALRPENEAPQPLSCMVQCLTLIARGPVAERDPARHQQPAEQSPLADRGRAQEDESAALSA